METEKEYIQRLKEKQKGTIYDPNVRKIIDEDVSKEKIIQIAFNTHGDISTGFDNGEYGGTEGSISSDLIILTNKGNIYSHKHYFNPKSNKHGKWTKMDTLEFPNEN